MFCYLSHSKILLLKRPTSRISSKPTLGLRYSSIMAETSPPQASPAPADTLPPLSRQDRDTYARMGKTMEMFHNSFRQTWKVLYGACSSGKRPANMSIRQFLTTGADFCHHLHMHHSIGKPLLLPLQEEPRADSARRGTTYLPRPRPTHARFSERIGAPDTA